MAASPLEPRPSALRPATASTSSARTSHELGAFKWRGALPALERYRARRRDGRRHGLHRQPRRRHGVGGGAARALARSCTCPRARARRSSRSSRRSGAEVVVDRRRPRRGEGAGACARASDAGLPFFEDGAEPAQLDGYAAIGDEILDQLDEEPAAVVVPVGNGALLAASGRALGAARPETRRIGVVSAGAPVMARSWRAGRAVECDLCDTIADGLAVRVAIPVAVDWLLETADDMLEVSESDIARPSSRSTMPASAPKLPRRPRSQRCPRSTPTGRSCSSSPGATSTTSCSPAAAPARRAKAAGRCARGGSRA